MVPDPPTLEPLDRQAITARLAGAGSMRAEIEHVLAAVPDGSSAEAYRAAILEDNVARKGTGTARMWAWLRLKLRYALDAPTSVEFAAFRRAMRDPDPRARGLSALLMLARRDRLFREASLTVVAPRLGTPGDAVLADAVHDDVEGRMRDGGLEWSPKSVTSISNHILSSWKDFGVVEGSKVRRIARLNPGHATVRFAVELGRAEGRTDRQVLDAPWFRLLGMDAAAAEGALRAAARDGVLQYRAQADVIEIALPADGD